MRKPFIIFITIITLLLLTANCNMHNGERPNDYPPARWVSEAPDMWFKSTESYTMYGQAMLEEKSIEIEVSFDYSNGIYINEKGKMEPFTVGRCTFSPRKLVVQIDKERDNFLKGKYDKITFIRKELDE